MIARSRGYTRHWPGQKSPSPDPERGTERLGARLSEGGAARSALGATVLGASAVAAAGVFLAHHRAEVGGLPAAARALAAAAERHGLVDLAGAGQVAAGIAAALLVIAAWHGLGALIVRGLRRADGPTPRAPVGTIELARTCGLGAGAWSLGWFALGLAGAFRPASAVGAAAIGLALAGWGVVRTKRARLAPSRPGRSDASPLSAAAVAAGLLVAIPLGLSFVAALAPPTAKDSLQYHLALPKAFVAGGGLVEVPGNVASYFALGAEMHGLWAMLLGRLVSARAGEVAFGAAMFAFFPLLLAAVAGWARERGVGRDWAWLAAAMVAAVPTVTEVAGSGYVDLALSLYALLAIRAVSAWWESLDRADLGESALALAFALTVKLTAAFVVFVVALIVLVRLRTALDADGGRRRLGGALAAIAGAVLLGSPWYLYTWRRTGSPVFPFFAGLWPGQAPGWDLERSRMLVGFNALYGGPDKGPLGYVLAPLSLSFAGQREVATAYEGVLGVAFLIGAALILWAVARRRLDRPFLIAAAAGGAFFVWWLASAQVLRYLFPALGLLAVAVAGAGAALGPSLRWALLVSVAAGELLTAAWFAVDNPALAATGAEPRADYLERRLDYYRYYRLINDTLPAGARIWLVDVRRDTYHLERPYVGDYLFEDYTLGRWLGAAQSGGEVQARAAAAGISHVLIRHDILLDPARSPLVDDAAPAADRLARLARLRAFLTEGTTVLRVDRRFALVALPAAPRPPSARAPADVTPARAAPAPSRTDPRTGRAS